MTNEERLRDLEERLAIAEHQLSVVLTAYRMLVEREAKRLDPNYVPRENAQA